MVYVSGLPGVGKTTLCRAVARRLGISLLRFDDLVTNAPPGLSDFARLVEAGTGLFSNQLTLCDSFPKGAEQARLLEPIVRPVLMLHVSGNPEVAAMRAQHRSPRRFPPNRIAEKFALRRKQTEELRRYCTARGVPVVDLHNGADRVAFIKNGCEIITIITRVEFLHAER